MLHVSPQPRSCAKKKNGEFIACKVSGTKRPLFFFLMKSARMVLNNWFCDYDISLYTASIALMEIYVQVKSKSATTFFGFFLCAVIFITVAEEIYN